jgi:hypothetical protein
MRRQPCGGGRHGRLGHGRPRRGNRAADRVEPDRPGDPPGGDTALTVDLQLAAVNEATAAVKTVWLEYADDTGTGRWQDT